MTAGIEEDRLRNGMLAQIIVLFEDNNVSTIRFDKLDDNAVIKPRIKDEYFGEILGISVIDGDIYIINDKDGSRLLKDYRIYYNEVYSILACVETCLNRKNAKLYRGLGVVIKKQ